MEGIIMTVQLLLGLSILVGVHELGHLLAAKAFGMRVEKYSIGFPPKVWGKKFGETEYSIGMIPLGGFVKISGMIDESLDVKNLNAEPEPWEFRSKPAWQRLIVMMGGIIVNVITGIIVFIVLTYSQGEVYISKDELNKHGILAMPLGEELGFQTGDKIVNVNGQDFEKFKDLTRGEVLLSDDGFYTVEREGSLITIPIPNDFIDNFSERDSGPFIRWRTPFEVAEVSDGSPAQEAGLLPGDRFTRIFDTEVNYFDEFTSALDSLRGGSFVATVERDGRPLDLTFNVREDGMIGIMTNHLIEFSRVDYTIGESIAKGSFQAFNIVWINIKAFRKMFAGEVSASKSLSGPIGIARFFGGTWDWVNFWQITGLLSMVLAFMNFLPIPALDGGHVMFLTWEIVTGQKPSDRFLESAQKVGMILLLGIMTYAIFNDIVKLF